MVVSCEEGGGRAPTGARGAEAQGRGPSKSRHAEAAGLGAEQDTQAADERHTWVPSVNLAMSDAEVITSFEHEHGTLSWSALDFSVHE